MHGYRVRARSLAHFRKLDRRVFVAEALAEFDGNKLVRAFFYRKYDFLGALYVRHERAALAVAYNLFLRTAHVYVDDFKSVEAFFFQRRDKRVRLPSEKLSGYDAIFGNVQQVARNMVVHRKPLCRNHFGNGKPAAEVLCQRPESCVRVPRKRA